MKMRSKIVDKSAFSMIEYEMFMAINHLTWYLLRRGGIAQLVRALA